MPNCLVCSAEFEPFVSFGKMPIANGFLTEDQFQDEYFFDLAVGFCTSCTTVQLTELVPPEKLYHDNYAYFSSTSAFMGAHFDALAHEAQKLYMDGNDPFAVEIGSNDGILLKEYSRQNIRHLGVDPSANVTEAASARGVTTLRRFFNRDTAADILNEHGPADVIIGANVVSHIPDIHSVFSGVGLLLKRGGVFIVEVPYLGGIVENTTYDQFYDEHVFYFSLSSLDTAAGMHGMEVIDAKRFEVHGGSIRYYLVRRGEHSPSPAVDALRTHESSLGLAQSATYQALNQRIDGSRFPLKEQLEKLKRDGQRVVGYGATAKSTIVTNYCGIGPDLVEFISDTTPTKHGKFSPGTHIPVRPYEDFQSSYPDYALLLAWNHQNEILAKEQEFRSGGGKFITYIPSVKVLGQP